MLAHTKFVIPIALIGFLPAMPAAADPFLLQYRRSRRKNGDRQSPVHRRRIRDRVGR